MKEKKKCPGPEIHDFFGLTGIQQGFESTPTDLVEQVKGISIDLPFFTPSHTIQR